MTRPLELIFIGLSLSSSWSNGHATTFRALIRGLNADGHKVLFLERDVPWYANNRDLADPDFCELAYYDDLDEMVVQYAKRLRAADAVIVGSYVFQGIDVIDRLATLGLQRLCFYDIDTPVTLSKLDHGDEEYLARRQIAVFQAYFSFSGGEVLKALEARYGAQRAIALYCSVDSDRYGKTDDPTIWEMGYLGTYSVDRQPTLERLLLEPARQLPDSRFVVAGPQYPDNIDWPANVERIDHLPPSDHARFYSRQRFTLSVTRADMIAAGWSPSVRLFEAAACATPIISDAWRGLDELLPDGQALVIARTSQDVISALVELPEARRRSMAERARAIVLEGHTGRARAREFAEAISRLPAVPAPPIAYQQLSA
ncbi:glycosyltransferase [Rhizobium sp. SIMBA_035]